MDDPLDSSGRAGHSSESPNRASKGKFLQYLRRLRSGRTRSELGHLILGMGLGMYLTMGVAYGIIIDAVPSYVGRFFLVLWVALLFWLLGVILTGKKRATGKKQTPPETEDSETQQPSR